MSEELERTTFSYCREILFRENRAQENRMAAVLTEKKLESLRKKSDQSRCLPARSKSFQSSLRGPVAPAAPPTAHRGMEVSGGPPSHQAPPQGRGPQHEGSGIRGHPQA